MTAALGGWSWGEGSPSSSFVSSATLAPAGPLSRGREPLSNGSWVVAMGSRGIGWTPNHTWGTTMPPVTGCYGEQRESRGFF